MLYVSTRNTADAFTAYRALHENCAPDGGFFAPFRLSVFSQEDLLAIRKQSQGQTVAQLLNCLFGLHLSAWEVESVIGRYPLRCENMSHRFIIAEMWHNPDGSWNYLICALHHLMTGNTLKGKLPTGWQLIGIQISLLFGLYGVLDDITNEEFDIAVSSSDFVDVMAAIYARDMGLPIRMTVLACDENSTIWDFLRRGILITSGENVQVDSDDSRPRYLEYFLHRFLGTDEVLRYLKACSAKTTYYLEDEQRECFGEQIYAAAVSASRTDVVISSMFRMNGYRIDSQAAFAYGGLQDYRSSTGVSKTTLILAKQRLNASKE